MVNTPNTISGDNSTNTQPLLTKEDVVAAIKEGVRRRLDSESDSEEGSERGDVPSGGDSDHQEGAGPCCGPHLLPGGGLQVSRFHLEQIGFALDKAMQSMGESFATNARDGLIAEALVFVATAKATLRIDQTMHTYHSGGSGMRVCVECERGWSEPPRW